MSFTFSQETNEMLVELLAGEKEDARVWLQAEMDRLVGPFVDSIFNRLQTKLTNGLERTQSGDGDGDCGELMNPTEHDQLANHLTQLANDNPLPSPSTHLSTSNLTSFHLHLQNDQSQFPTSPVSLQPVSITSITLPNETTNVQSQYPMPIKQETEPSANEPITESNQNFDYLNDEDDEEEEECYCDDCVNGGLELEIKLDDDDDDSDDSVELIEYEEDREQLSRPVKRARLDTTQPNNEQTEVIGESLGQATQPNQVNSHDNKQIITLSLRCPESNCPGTFSGDHIVTQLSDHLWHEHSIRLFRCLVKDCRQSFENTRILGEHIKHSHQHTTKWHCDKCSKHFTEYRTLSSHNFQLHQIGHFQCTFPSCTFTGENRAKVFNHYTQQHRRTLSCRHSDCPFLSSSSSDLKRHERSHLGIKPYRCRWPDCHYASTQRTHTINHIRHQHLAPNPSGSVPNGAQLDPSDYLEVVHDLL